MDNRLVLLLVAYFVAELVSSPSLATPEVTGAVRTATTAANLKTEANAAAKKQVVGPWSVVCEHFGRSAESVPVDKLDAAQTEAKLRERWCLLKDDATPIVSVIVMLPDPRQTRLTLDFDRYIQTIERAAAERGYAMDRFWLPWKAEREPLREDNEDSTRHQPGLIWFRSAKLNEPKYLAAFLVGETPVAGINQRAFRHAVNYSRLLSRKAGIRVAGPFSTGGLASLDRALQDAGYSRRSRACSDAGDDPREGAQVKIVSGTVTGDEQGAFKQHWCLETVASPDDKTLDAVRAEFGDTGLALLAESATSYGEDASQRNGPELLRLRFPREMAWLRKAYEDDPQLSRTGALDDPAVRNTLKGKLEMDAVGADAVSIFSRSQTPLLQEAELLAVAREVKEHHVSKLVLFATDILDTTFLARFFRRCCDVRPIIFEPDLYLSRRDGFPLPGTLAVNRTILVPHGKDHQVFTSGSVWGLYQSIEVLLSQKSSGDESLWLSVVGKNGYWPVAKLQGKAVTSWPLMPPRAWQNGMLVVTVTLLVFCWALTFAQRTGSAFGSRRMFWSFAIDGKLGRERSPYVLGTLLSLAGTALMLGLPVLDRARLEVEGNEPWVVGVLLVLAMGVVVFALVRIGLPRPRWLALAIWCVFTSIMATWAWCLFNKGPRSLFFSVRAVHIESGVSPSLPFICLILVLGVWSWTQVLRLRVYHERQPIVPAPDTADRIWAVRTRHVFLRPLVQGWKMFALVLTVVVLVCVAAGGGQMLSTIEGRVYDWTFRLMVLLVAMLVVLALMRAHYAWRTLWDVLQHIETQPFREKFQEVGKDFNWYSIFEPGGSTVNLRPVDRSFECARELAHAAAGDEELDEERTLMSSLEPARAKFKDRLLTLRYATQEEAVALAEESHQALVQAAEGLVRKYGDSPRPKNPSVVRELVDEFISLQYVHYIRQVFVLFSQLASFVMTSFVLLVIALNSYPFSEPRAISLWVLGSFLGVAAFTVVVFWQMDRDPVLSRMSNTTGGKLDRHFWSLLVQYGGLPLIAVLGSQFPELGSVVSRWLGATGDLLK